MGKRTHWIGHSLVATLAVLAGCGGDAEPAQLAYGAVRDEVPARILVVEEDGANPQRIAGARQGTSPVLPVWSPDGRRLAFVRYRPAGGPGAFQVYVVNADGTRERHLGEGTLPRWTRDGRALVVERPRVAPQISTLHVVPLRGAPRRLTLGSAPAVSRRGARVAFLRYTFTEDPEGRCCVRSRATLYTIGLDGSGLRRIATSRRNTYFAEPSWLPDGSLSVIERPTQGGVVGPLLAFSPNGARRVVATGVGETYDWSPADDRVAYTTGDAVHVARRDGTAVATFENANAIDIEWSPDGQKIAYSMAEGGATDAPFVGIYVADVEDRESERIVFTNGFVAYFDWRPPQDDA